MYYFILSSELNNSLYRVGNKSRGLFFLQEQGFLVPTFLVLPAHKIQEIKEKKPSTDLITEIQKNLDVKKYIVRSNMLGEDSEKNSEAGQFLTKSNLILEDVPSAIYEVIDHAMREKNLAIKNCSVIVQEYIDADVSGVLFTRNPRFGLDFLLEYHRGKGEDLVSGDIIPKRVCGRWYAKDNVMLPGWKNIKKKLELIEMKKKHPQDIEWCIKDGQWFLLQSRNITSISNIEYVSLLKLEEVLAYKKEYRFVKNDVTDVLGDAVPIMESLVEKIYASDGPISKAYKRHNIVYKNDKDVVVSFGKDFFVDSNQELKTVLPALSLLNKKRKPHWKQCMGSFVTLRNLFGLTFLKGNIDVNIEESLNFLESKISTKSIQKWLDDFTIAYESIFDVNLIYGVELKKLELIVSPYKKDIKEVVYTIGKLSNTLHNVVPPVSLVGNSLSINDLSSFYSVNHLMNEHNNVELLEWWNGLSNLKKIYIEKQASIVLNYEKLREIGRWITVKYMSALREILKNVAYNLSIKDYRDFYFLTLDQLVEDTNNIEELIVKQKKEYDFRIKLPFLSEIDSMCKNQNSSSVIGVSPGQASGQLVREEDLLRLYKNKPCILFTETLSPSLTKYFDKVAGIYSKRGGILSHLAIIAREKGIPVIVDSRENAVSIGDTLEIDGTSARLKIIKKI